MDELKQMLMNAVTNSPRIFFEGAKFAVAQMVQRAVLHRKHNANPTVVRSINNELEKMDKKLWISSKNMKM